MDINPSVTVSGESGCNVARPVALLGVCKDDYADCVANVLTQLRDMTPYTEHQSFSSLCITQMTQVLRMGWFWVSRLALRDLAWMIARAAFVQPKTGSTRIAFFRSWYLC
ncbi:hypothetical protein LINPERPRIM_LOCUS25600 [Linum perenne]